MCVPSNTYGYVNNKARDDYTLAYLTQLAQSTMGLASTKSIEPKKESRVVN